MEHGMGLQSTRFANFNVMTSYNRFMQQNYYYYRCYYCPNTVKAMINYRMTILSVVQSTPKYTACLCVFIKFSSACKTLYFEQKIAGKRRVKYECTFKMFKKLIYQPYNKSLCFQYFEDTRYRKRFKPIIEWNLFLSENKLKSVSTRNRIVINKRFFLLRLHFCLGGYLN